MIYKKLIFNFAKIYRIENIFKNILIFFPLLLSDRSSNTSDIITLILGFLIFTFLTSICYVTNDFTDYKKDLINKLKSKKKILKKNKIIIFNIILFFFLILLFFSTNLINFYLILYLFLFYFYNFF